MKKKIGFAAILVGAIIAVLLWKIKTASTHSSFQGESKWITLPNDLDIEELKKHLEADSILSSGDIFWTKTIAQLKSFSKAKKGKYKISKNTSINTLINTFRSGNQTPILVKVDGVRTINQLAASLGKQLEADSASFMNAFSNLELLKKYEINISNVSGLILPNVYDFYWTVSPEEFVKRMERIHAEFWTVERMAKLNNLNMSKFEVITLASIVKGETVKTSEAPMIARLYLNRLKKGMKLEADPTVSFAKQLQGVERIYHKDLSFDSPYNTYKYSGLPPGPIFFTEPVYVDAVLDAPAHNFIFMCAQPGATGLHNFSETYGQHLIYARAYHDWLNKNNIK